jgi:hypothetical protein
MAVYDASLACGRNFRQLRPHSPSPCRGSRRCELVGRTKGIALLSIVKFLRRHRDEALEVLAPEYHHYLDDHIDVSGWYPGPHLPVLLRAAAQMYTSPLDRALQIIGEATVRAQADVYGELLTGAGSQSRVFALWTSQYDTGHLRRVRESANALRFELTDFEDTAREHCLVLTGYFTGAIAVCGLDDAHAEKTTCRLWGDPLCTWRVTWKGPTPRVG